MIFYLNIFSTSQFWLFALMGIMVLTVLFLPKKGLLANYLKRKNKNKQRIFVEDALKFLFDCEYKQKTCDIDSIAGKLKVSDDKAAQLIDELSKSGFITLQQNLIMLTDKGKTDSLKIIRSHRILEKYFADETGVHHLDWHKKADKLEHNVSNDVTEKLAKQMGNPVYDPHGDPIPSSEGVIPEMQGSLLSVMQAGQTGKIVHIEDEPKIIYKELVDQGLYLSMELTVNKQEDGMIYFTADDKNFSLTQLAAMQITVVLQAGKEKKLSKNNLLSNLKMGEEAEIMGISPNCRGQQRRRLMDLGIIPGSVITPYIYSPAGNLTGYRVMETTIGIRKNQAEMIYVKKIAPSNE